MFIIYHPLNIVLYPSFPRKQYFFKIQLRLSQRRQQRRILRRLFSMITMMTLPLKRLLAPSLESPFLYEHQRLLLSVSRCLSNDPLLVVAQPYHKISLQQQQQQPTQQRQQLQVLVRMNPICYNRWSNVILWWPLLPWSWRWAILCGNIRTPLRPYNFYRRCNRNRHPSRQLEPMDDPQW